jgi:hypothetical protein
MGYGLVLDVVTDYRLEVDKPDVVIGPRLEILIHLTSSMYVN